MERQPALGDRVRRLPARFGRGQGVAVRPCRGRGLDRRAVARAVSTGRPARPRSRPLPLRAGVSDRVLKLRELNRALLARQLLLERVDQPIPTVLERICGIQNQYAPNAYIRLWS